VRDALLRAALLAAALVATSASSGCYYLHVGWGQAKVLAGREPIERVLKSSALDADEKTKLAVVPKVRAFAQGSLGLVRNDSYTKFYDTGRKPISWNVTACRTTSFTPFLWKFPFVGAAPYKGFFDLDDARAEAADLKALGYDVCVREVGAYSTLGWFDDPVFRPMLAYDVHDLAETIIHELTHATVFKSGDGTFNESVATFVGREGALAFLRAEFGAASIEIVRARDSEADEGVFAAFIDDLYARLDKLYRGPLADDEKRAVRVAMFAAAKGEFELLRRTRMRDPDSYAWFAKRPLDNAVILGYRRYHTDLDVYAAVLRLCGGDWRRALRVFRAAAEAEEPRAYLAAWRTRAEAARAKVAAASRAEAKPVKKGGDRGQEGSRQKAGKG
jgi:predicted aminopeptidase